MDLVRPLGLAGIRCAVVCEPSSPSRFTRFACATIEALSPTERPDDLVERLLAWGGRQPERPVLFYQQDADVLLVSRHRDRLAEAFRFVVGDPEVVEELVDKDRFRALAERLGLAVPRASRLRPAGTPPASLDLEFPLILKPLPSRNEAWDRITPAKAVEVEDLEGLRQVWSRLASTGLDVLAQELVPGPETRIESYHAYIPQSGVPVAEFTGVKVRTRPRHYGHTTALEITAAADVADAGRRLLDRLGLRGVAKVDFKRAPDGSLHLLEVNPRFSLWHHPGALAGVNLPELVFRDLAGLPRPVVRPARAGIRWSYLERDLPAAREAGLSMADWLRWVLRSQARSGIALDDPLPFLRGVLARRAARGFQAVSERPSAQSAG